MTLKSVSSGSDSAISIVQFGRQAKRELQYFDTVRGDTIAVSKWTTSGPSGFPANGNCSCDALSTVLRVIADRTR